MKTLLTTLNAKYIHINLAIRQLYALNKDKHDIKWREFTINEPQEPIAEFCAQFDIVALSCYIWNITQTLQVTKLIKSINPNTKILLGGPEVSYEWQDVIADESIDYIITGEGEIPFQKFLDNYPSVQDIPSLVRKENGTDVFCNPLVESFPVENYLNIMPYAYDDPDSLKNKVIYLETSRGCPYKCEFCLASLDNKVRYLPDAHIKATLLHAMKYGRTIKFLDRTFNIKKDFTIGMFQFILDNHSPGNIFQFEITADIVHPDIIAFIQEKVPSGLFRFEIGIQTVNQTANLEVSRKQNFDKTKGIIQQLQNKIEMHLDLIVGLPLDYWADIKYSFEEVFKLFAPELQLGFLKFLKGTPVRHKHHQHGYKFHAAAPYQIISSNYLSEQELEQITIVENALEIYWNKARAVHTLKYVTQQYSIFDFLQGLGNYFIQFNSFHKFTHQNIFEHLYNYAALAFPDDKVLLQLIAIDYGFSHKVKAKILFKEELNKEQSKQFVFQNNLPHNHFRFAILPISFQWNHFIETNTIVQSEEIFILRYNGKDYPIVYQQVENATV
jgi:anaerobic magnesium-protoporphyrin IX monomethyl ester cyclase